MYANPLCVDVSYRPSSIQRLDTVFGTNVTFSIGLAVGNIRLIHTFTGSDSVVRIVTVTERPHLAETICAL